MADDVGAASLPGRRRSLCGIGTTDLSGIAVVDRTEQYGIGTTDLSGIAVVDGPQ